MKMLFIFASANGLQAYSPILSALREAGHAVKTLVTAEVRDPSSELSTDQIEEKRREAFYEIKSMEKLDIVFVEQEFAWLAIGFTHAEKVLKPEISLEQVMSIVEKHHSSALA